MQSALFLLPIFQGRSYGGSYNVNTFLMQLGNTKDIVEQKQKNILLGEAHAMRAYILFDMLRLFGPVYPTDSLKAAIPYPTIASDQVYEILPATVVMDSVLEDIDRSLLLLAEDHSYIISVYRSMLCLKVENFEGCCVKVLRCLYIKNLVPMHIDCKLNRKNRKRGKKVTDCLLSGDSLLVRRVSLL